MPLQPRTSSIAGGLNGKLRTSTLPERLRMEAEAHASSQEVPLRPLGQERVLGVPLMRLGVTYLDGVELSLRKGQMHAYDFDKNNGRTLCGINFGRLGSDWIDGEFVTKEGSEPSCKNCLQVLHKGEPVKRLRKDLVDCPRHGIRLGARMRYDGQSETSQYLRCPIVDCVTTREVLSSGN